MKNEKSDKKSNETKVNRDLDILSEIKALSDKAMEGAGLQSELFPIVNNEDEDIEVDSIDFSKISQEADPVKSHQLFYGVQALLKENLPKGTDNEKLRRLVYDEKNLFLNAGKISGSDSRQAFIKNFLDEAFNTTKEWVENGANPFDIYMRFRTLNIERGYRDR